MTNARPGQFPARRGDAGQEDLGSGLQQPERGSPPSSSGAADTSRATREVFDIQFSQLGEFVYHCHILEHEDGGMMARIMVVPAPN